MTDLARRAFRRPVTTREVEKYIELDADGAQKEEGSFEEGLAVGIQALLVSPDFLFRLERDRPGTAPAAAYRITPHELATRLSYFLWASMPDAELRRAADAGTLRDPQILAFQVRRMLRDPKAHALAEQFGGQWLQFRALESLTRDRDKFPEFEDYLRLSMRRETELFIETIVRDDRSVLDFINGRYSFLNERLARHYGIPNVSGPVVPAGRSDRNAARRRADAGQRPRGVVVRDANVAGAARQVGPRQPAQRSASRAAGRRAEPRRVEHRHLGVDARAARRAPEERDLRLLSPADGPARIRPRELRRRRRVADDGRQVSDRRLGPAPRRAHGSRAPTSCATILSADRDAFARAITSKLLTYGLGRGLERYDNRTVKLIASRLPKYDYRFSGLVLEIVNSLPFQSRRAAPASRPERPPDRRLHTHDTLPDC